MLNGEKIFVTAGKRAVADSEGFVVVWASIDKSAGRAGIKSFLIEKGTPGFIVAHKEKKLGIRADDTAAYVFQNCRIPRDNLLGGSEDIPKAGSGGFKGVMKTFNMTRPGVAAIGLGMAEAALDFTREQIEAAGHSIAYGGASQSQPACVEAFLRLEAQFEAARLTILKAGSSEQSLPNPNTTLRPNTSPVTSHDLARPNAGQHPPLDTKRLRWVPMRTSRSCNSSSRTA